MVLHKDIFQTIAQLNKLNESFAIATVILLKDHHQVKKVIKQYSIKQENEFLAGLGVDVLRIELGKLF